MTKLEEKQLVAAEVLREQGWSVRRVAKELGVDESTVRYRLRRRAQAAGDGRRCRQERCAVHGEVIAVWLERQAEARRPESIRMLYEELVLEHGYTGTYQAVRRYVRRRAGVPAVRPIRRVETKPGAQAQIDWLEMRLWLDDCLTRVSAFLMTLSYSRMWAVIWSLREDLLSWIRCHNEAFQRLGGIPYTVRIDNLKTGVVWGAGSSAVLHPGYESYARQVRFIIDPCRPRRPSDKGKVERRGRDVKWLLVRAGERFSSLASLQATTDRRVSERVAHLLCPVSGRPIVETWREEQLVLSPLPPTLPQPFDLQVSREVGPDCLVSFEGRQYSVPFSWAGRSVEVRGTAGDVEIYGDRDLIARFPRGTECRLLIDQDHYEHRSGLRGWHPHRSAAGPATSSSPAAGKRPVGRSTSTNSFSGACNDRHHSTHHRSGPEPQPPRRPGLRVRARPSPRAARAQRP